MIYNKISSSLHDKFKQIVGENNFFSQFEIRWSYTFGGFIFNKEWVPDLILVPQNSMQISEILKLASKNKIPIRKLIMLFDLNYTPYLNWFFLVIQ